MPLTHKSHVFRSPLHVASDCGFCEHHNVRHTSMAYTVFVLMTHSSVASHNGASGVIYIESQKHNPSPYDPSIHASIHPLIDKECRYNVLGVRKQFSVQIVVLAHVQWRAMKTYVERDFM